jgi:hypothetical protein
MIGRVDERRGAAWAVRLPSPLIKPGVRFSRIKCCAPRLMRNVASVVMWRWAWKAYPLNPPGALIPRAEWRESPDKHRW